MGKKGGWFACFTCLKHLLLQEFAIKSPGQVFEMMFAFFNLFTATLNQEKLEKNN